MIPHVMTVILNNLEFRTHHSESGGPLYTSAPSKLSIAALIAGPAIFFSWQQPALADQLFSQRNAHVHGVSELTIVGERNTLLMEFSSPAVNLVGFESSQLTVEQRAVVDDMLTRLEDVSTLIAHPSDDCAMINAHTSVRGLEHEQPSGHGISDEYPDDHLHHADDHTHHHHGNNGHLEFHAIYEWQCSSLANLSTITTHVFLNFPGVESLNVQWVIDAHQGAASLNPGRINVRLR